MNLFRLRPAHLRLDNLGEAASSLLGCRIG
jgi:hypothetical protein